MPRILPLEERQRRRKVILSDLPIEEKSRILGLAISTIVTYREKYLREKRPPAPPRPKKNIEQILQKYPSTDAMKRFFILYHNCGNLAEDKEVFVSELIQLVREGCFSDISI